jgi:prophage regulatory protein
MKQLRITQDTTAELLGVSISSLNRYKKRPGFPKPIKDGTSRQAPVYFIASEIEAWLNLQMAARNTSTSIH